ncbi:50S ribosomal protein L6 [Candidatus Micrarchaeota archaeon]|nr:50S ribosomal protein L6 [Candidatus Micrarchaeota archaeon]
MIEVPNGVTVSVVDGNSVQVKGKLGSASRVFPAKGLKLEKKEAGIEVTAPTESIATTVTSVIKSLLKGVSEGYTKKMTVIYSHFPISVEVKGKVVLVKNFLGEKKPRESKIIGETKVQAKGAEITITGVDKEHVSQTIANMKTATRITKRDSRVFQDGVYVVEE